MPCCWQALLQEVLPLIPRLQSGGAKAEASQQAARVHARATEGFVVLGVVSRLTARCYQSQQQSLCYKAFVRVHLQVYSVTYLRKLTCASMGA